MRSSSEEGESAPINDSIESDEAAQNKGTDIHGNNMTASGDEILERLAEAAGGKAEDAVTPSPLVSRTATPPTDSINRKVGENFATELPILDSPSAKHEKRVRSIVFSFPWSHTPSREHNGSGHSDDANAKEMQIEDLKEKLAAAEFASEEKINALLAQLDLCEIETEDKLSRLREDCELANKESDRLRHERTKFLEEHAKLEQIAKVTARELEEIKWSAQRAEEQSKVEQTKNKARAKEAQELLDSLRSEIETLKSMCRKAEMIQAKTTGKEAAELNVEPIITETDSSESQRTNIEDLDRNQTSTSNALKSSSAEVSEKQKKSLKHHITLVRAEIDQVSESLRKSLDENRKLTSKLRESELARSQLEAQVSLLTATRTVLEERASNLEAAVSDAEYNIEELREALQSATTDSKAKLDQTEQVSSEKLRALGEDLANMEARAKEAELALADASSKLAVADRENSELEERARNLAHSKEDIEGELRLMRLDLDHAKSRRNSAEEGLRLQEEKIQMLETQARQQEEEARKASRDAQQEARALATANALSQRRLETSVKALEQENNRLVEMQKTMRKRMEEEMSRFEEELRREAEDGGAKLHSLELAKDEVEGLLKAEHTRTLELTKEIQAEELKNRGLETKVQSLEDNLLACQKNNERLQDKEKLLSEEKEKATSDLEAMKDELENVNSENIEMRENLNTLEAELEVATKTGSELRQCLVTLEDREERHNKEIKSLSDCIASLRESLQQSEKACSAATKECERQTQTLERRVEEKAQLIEERSKLMSIQAETDRELMKARGKEADLRGELASLLEDKRRADVMRRKHSDLKRKHAEALAETEQLKRNITELKQKTNAALLKNLEMRDNELVIMRKRMRSLASKVGRME